VTAVDLQRPAGGVVASVPADHAYIRHLGPEDGTGPTRLPDPDPDDPSRSAEQQWWPPAMLRPEWVRGHDFDLLHVHFGFDAHRPSELRRLTKALRSRGKPLVFTVHDLRNPHHAIRDQHDVQLDVLVEAADALITLTPGAAAEIERRWGRRAHVVPHPHVVEFRRMEIAADARARRRSGQFRVGLHVKSIRACMDPLAVLPVLVETVGGLPGAVLQVDAHLDTGIERELLALERQPHVDLRFHDYFDDASFESYLNSLDVSVLPYRFGTHSGWLEACRDLGTTVVAPTCGFYAEQGPVLSYVMDEERFEPESLAAAVTRAYDERPPFGATIPERRRQRAEVAAAHDAIYRSVTEPR
jgi:glycosyltransferase involved in cell wall biosynthesis